jgi:alpha-mannosidase
MSRAVAIALMLSFAVLAAPTANAAPVEIKSFLALPQQAEPGEKLAVRVVLADPEGQTAKAIVGVRGIPEVQIELRSTTAEAWDAQLDIPQQAPPATYTLEVRLLDAAGQPVAATGATSFAVQVVPVGRKHLTETVSQKLDDLRQVLGLPLSDWRWKVGDFPQAAAPGFDDSSWTMGSPEIEWRPENSVAWFRKEIVIPDKVAGFDVAGSPVTLLVGVDDDGEIYVNGALKQKFHWDQGHVTLTDKAEPGEKFLVAIKGYNGPGGGRLFSAELRFESLNDLRREVGAYLGDLEFGQAALQQAVMGGEGLRKAIDESVGLVDLKALSAGDKQAFLASLRVARGPLRPVAALVKAYTVHLVGHAHIDMNWLWLWPETVEVCRATFRQALDFMGDASRRSGDAASPRPEFPGFTFSQSQASTYLAMEQNYPEIFAEIGQRVKEGRWEVTGGTWVEGDMNMASGEAIVRQILYAKRYFRDKFGVDVRIAWEPDTFGHAWTVPQILKKAGIDYYYFCRCGKDIPLFWWEAPDGSRVLAYNLGGYSSDVNPGIGNLPLELKRNFGVSEAMVVYGVGDHGGGPTRQSIETALELQRRQIFPRVKFSTAQGFFDRVLSENTEFPVVRDELNFTFEGCYTTHADIKRMNRISENLLPTAEAFSALAATYGRSYPRDEFVAAWRNTCFNQFHDIFDGSAIHGSYEYSRGLFDEARKIGDTALHGALETIAKRIDTRGPGAAVVVFNPMAWDREDTAVAAVDLPAGTMAVRVTDDAGRQAPAQVVGRDADNGLLQVAFTAQVPSLGYRVFHIEPLAQGKPSGGEATADDSGRIENEFWRVHVDRSNGTVTSIFDKRSQLELVPPSERANLLQALFEKPHGMSAWDIGEISRTEDLDGPAEVQVVERGPARAAIRVTRKWRSSTFTQDITLYGGIERIDFITTANWREIGTPTADFPMIKVAFPVALSCTEANFEIPFGAIVRPADGHEVPALKWIDLSGIARGGTEYGLSLLNDSKYGHDVNGHVMRLTLLRCPYDPDPRPDEGVHHFTYSLYPHAQSWRRAATVRRGYELNNPLISLAQPAHAGALPANHSYLRVEPESLVVTAFKRAEDSDDIIVRFYDCGGVPVRGRLFPGFTWASAVDTNLMETPTGAAIDTGASHVGVDVNPWEIKTVRVSATEAR